MDDLIQGNCLLTYNSSATIWTWNPKDCLQCHRMWKEARRQQ